MNWSFHVILCSSFTIKPSIIVPFHLSISSSPIHSTLQKGCYPLFWSCTASPIPEPDNSFPETEKIKRSCQEKEKVIEFTTIKNLHKLITTQVNWFKLVGDVCLSCFENQCSSTGLKSEPVSFRFYLLSCLFLRVSETRGNEWSID